MSRQLNVGPQCRVMSAHDGWFWLASADTADITGQCRPSMSARVCGVDSAVTSVWTWHTVLRVFHESALM